MISTTPVQSVTSENVSRFLWTQDTVELLRKTPTQFSVSIEREDLKGNVSEATLWGATLISALRKYTLAPDSVAYLVIDATGGIWPVYCAGSDALGKLTGEAIGSRAIPVDNVLRTLYPKSVEVDL